MTASTFQPLDIAAPWGRMNETIARLVDYVPDDKLDWAPKPELWNFRGVLIHICGVRMGWTAAGTGTAPDWAAIVQEAQTRDGIKRQLALSWEAVAGFVSSPEKLAGQYDEDDGTKVTGHWIAFHLLEDDIHHRADIFHYLALLGIETPEVGTP